MLPCVLELTKALVSILRLQKSKHDSTKRDADRARARTVQPGDRDFEEITRQHRYVYFIRMQFTFFTLLCLGPTNKRPRCQQPTHIRSFDKCRGN